MFSGRCQDPDNVVYSQWISASSSPTSTIVAALSTIELTNRLDQFASNHNATYTQYVDDVTVSGPRHMAKMVPLLGKIIHQAGLKANPTKTKVAQGKEEKCVTGIRVNIVPDVTSKKMKEVRGLLDSEDLRSSKDQKVASLEGKIRYVEGLNRGAGRYLRKRLRKIKASRSDIQPNSCDHQIE
jgi:retron-type reverse transcriptase